MADAFGDCLLCLINGFEIDQRIEVLCQLSRRHRQPKRRRQLLLKIDFRDRKLIGNFLGHVATKRFECFAI